MIHVFKSVLFILIVYWKERKQMSKMGAKKETESFKLDWNFLVHPHQPKKESSVVSGAQNTLVLAAWML